MIVENIEKLLYMDDISTGADITEDARKICKISREIFFKANMNLQKRNSNSKKLDKYM